MGFSYHFSLCAPAHVTAADLATFLENVEGHAKLLGFASTIIVNGPSNLRKERLPKFESWILGLA
jgi:hypothetical protein